MSEFESLPQPRHRQECLEIPAVDGEVHDGIMDLVCLSYINLDLAKELADEINVCYAREKEKLAS